LPRIKVCGVTIPEQAVQIAGLGVWAIGCILVPGSSRYISPARAREIVQVLPPHVLKVGVFRDEDSTHLDRLRSWCGFDLVQLHGKESPAYCRTLGKGLIKVFGVREGVGEIPYGDYSDVVDYFLFDSVRKGTSGGTGVSFPWERLPALATLGRPVIIAGGLNETNIQTCHNMLAPFAFDLNSGVEISPGNKEIGKVERILRLLSHE